MRPGASPIIAFVSDAVFPYHKGGKEMRLYEITRRLAQDGLTVDVYTMKWWDGPSSIEQDGVRFHAICPRYELYVDERRSMKQALLFGLATLRLMTRRFDAVDVDSMPFFPLFSARLVCSLKRKPLYSSWHEVTSLTSWQAYLGPAKGRIAHAVERLATSLPDAIISNSTHTTGRLLAQGSRQTVHTVPLGIDVGQILAAEPALSGTDILFVGRLVEHKHVDVLIEAVALIKRDRPTIRCRIVGQGPEAATLRGLTARRTLTDNVTFTDFIENNSDIYALMKASRLFVLPSTREGFGLVAVEAQAAGIPVITVNHPDNAARDLIIQNQNGIITDLNPGAIAAAITTILDAKHPMDTRRGIERHDWSVAASAVRAIMEPVS